MSIELLKTWRELNPDKITQSFAMDAITRNRFSNSIPTIGQLMKEGDQSSAPPIAAFFGIRVVVDPNVPRNEIHHRNSKGELLEVTKLHD